MSRQWFGFVHDLCTSAAAITVMTSFTIEDVTLTYWAGVGARAGRSEDEFIVYNQLYYRGCLTYLVGWRMGLGQGEAKMSSLSITSCTISTAGHRQ